MQLEPGNVREVEEFDQLGDGGVKRRVFGALHVAVAVVEEHREYAVDCVERASLLAPDGALAVDRGLEWDGFSVEWAWAARHSILEATDLADERIADEL